MNKLKRSTKHFAGTL